MVRFVTAAQAAQDGDRRLLARFGDENFLEAAFERGVFLDVFAVFVQGRRADAVQLAAGEHRFEHVRGVNRAFAGGARSDQCVQFVNEDDDIAFFGDVLEYGL